MPEIRDYEDKRVKVLTRFRGIRRWGGLAWVPFITGQKPSIRLTVYLKDTQFEIDGIAIDCNAPKHREDSTHDDYYGWYAENVRTDHAYDVTLPKLDRAGNYEYRINVSMKYEDARQLHFIHSVGKIMTTGRVSWKETISTTLLGLVVGSMIGAAITAAIQCPVS